MASNDPLEKSNYIDLPGKEDENKHPQSSHPKSGGILVPPAEAKLLACFWTVFRQFQMPGCTWFLRKINGFQAPKRVGRDCFCFASVKCKLRRRVHLI